MIDYGFNIKLLTGGSIKELKRLEGAVSSIERRLKSLSIPHFNKIIPNLNTSTSKRLNSEIDLIKKTQHYSMRSQSAITDLIRVEVEKRENIHLRSEDRKANHERRLTEMNQRHKNKMAELGARREIASMRGAGIGGRGIGGRGIGGYRGFGAGGFLGAGSLLNPNIMGMFSRTMYPLVGGYAAYSAGRSIYDVGTYLESIGVQMTSLFGGDIPRAEAMKKSLIDFAGKTPLSMKESMHYGRMLIGTGIFPDKQIIPSLKMLGDVASGSGGDLFEIIRNYTQAFGKGKMDMIDLKQYATHGVPVRRFLPDILLGRKGFEEFSSKEQISGNIDNLVRHGRITGEVIRDLFTMLTSEGGIYYNHMYKSMENTQGKADILWQKTQIKMNDLFEKLQPSINKALDSATKFVENFDKVMPSLTALADPFIYTWDIIKKLGSAMGIAAFETGDFTSQVKGALDVLKLYLGTMIAVKGVMAFINGLKWVAALGTFATGLTATGGISAAISSALGIGAVTTTAAVGGTAATVGFLPALLTGAAIITITGVAAAIAYDLYNTKKGEKSTTRNILEIAHMGFTKDPTKLAEYLYNKRSSIINDSLEKNIPTIRKNEFKPIYDASKGFTNFGFLKEKQPIVTPYAVTPASIQTPITTPPATGDNLLTGNETTIGGRGATKIEIHNLIGQQIQTQNINDSLDMEREGDNAVNKIMEGLISVFTIQGAGN
jgi:phage tail tape-measure protein